MLRRDQFVQRYADLNNLKKLQAQVAVLEKYVDQQLVDSNSLLYYINQNGLGIDGTSGQLYSQNVTSSFVNNAVSRDQTVADNGNGRSGSNKQYAIWGSNITNSSGNDASQSPQFDLTLDTSISGQFRISLPADTNKNAAYMLLQQYIGPLVNDSTQITQAQIDNYGFWGRQPILGSNGSSANVNPNAVQLVYDADLGCFVMIFSL